MDMVGGFWTDLLKSRPWPPGEKPSTASMLIPAGVLVWLACGVNSDGWRGVLKWVGGFLGVIAALVVLLHGAFFGFWVLVALTHRTGLDGLGLWGLGLTFFIVWAVLAVLGGVLVVLARLTS